MSAHKQIDKICCLAAALSLVLTVLFMNAGTSGAVEAMSQAEGYETRLFDPTSVHTIDIVMEDWDSFLDTCTNEEYVLCSVVIDNETYRNVGIRAKGNTSLTQVESYGNDRYSFKIEFDHYETGKSYYGLDKLSLNNIIQDNTYMKDYITYRMMQEFGVDAPLCSYVNITVNGENWGLYLAVESVEEAFLSRNYGNDYGNLYKPDSMNMGAGRGNGGGFHMDEWDGEKPPELPEMPDGQEMPDETEKPELPVMPDGQEMPDETEKPELPEMPDGQEMPNETKKPEPFDRRQKNGPGTGGKSSDVSLIYSDDEYGSYSNIFENAKTEITNADKDRLIASLKKLNSGEEIEEVVNTEEVIRYFVVHNFVCNFDSYTGSMIHNYYLYEKDGRFSMIPWDYNLAFGGFQGAEDAEELVNYPIDTPVSGGTVESRPMLSWIFEKEEYTELYHQYFSEFISTYFDSGYFSEMIGSVKEMIAPYVEADATKFCTYEEFETGVSTLQEFCLLRAESIKGQLDGIIPADAEGQEQDSASFIDASGLQISDMGSMNSKMGGGMQPFASSGMSERKKE